MVEGRTGCGKSSRSGRPINPRNSPDSGTLAPPERERTRQRVGAGRIWDRGTEWDAVRSLLAKEARTAMGREAALDASPLTELTAVQSAIALTGEARLALGAEGPPPLDTIPDVRPVLARAGAEGSVLEGAELARLIPALDAGPRLQAWARAIQPIAAGVALASERLPRLTDLRDA